jgi:hypothetical protein
MLFEVPGEVVDALVRIDESEVEPFALRGGEGGAEGNETGVCDRPRGKSPIKIRIVRIGDL